MERIRKRRRMPTNMIRSEEDFADALRKGCGIQSEAARILGVTQGAVSQRVSKSEFLQEVVAEIRNEILDLAEGKLLEKLKEGHMTAIIFYLKCLGKARGYTEKSEVDVNQTQGGVLVVPGIADSVEEWERSVADLAKRNNGKDKDDENKIH